MDTDRCNGTHIIKVKVILVSQQQHKCASTGIPNITKHLNPHNKFSTAKYHVMTQCVHKDIKLYAYHNFIHTSETNHFHITVSIILSRKRAPTSLGKPQTMQKKNPNSAGGS